MERKDETEKHLLHEIAALRERIAELEKSETGRKEMEEKLLESENRLRAIVDYTHDCECWIDSKDKPVWISRAVFQLTGYTVDECMAMNDFPLPLVHEKDERKVAGLMSTRGSSNDDVEFRLRRKDGSMKWAAISWQPVYDRNGSSLGVRSSIRDITGRKHAEERLRKSVQRFRSLSEASLEAVVFIEDGIIVDANEALGRLFGYQGEDLQGRSAVDFIAPERRAFTEDRIGHRTEGAYETLGFRKDGSLFPIEVNSREYTYGRKRLRISAVRDLTDRKKIEKELKEYQEHLEKLVEERTYEVKRSEEKFRNIFENAVVGMYQSTPEGRFLRVNPALARIYGYASPEELVQSVTNIATQIYATPENRKAFIDLAEKDGIVRNFEVRVLRKDGSIKYVSVNARTVKDEKGDILCYEGIIQDITEKKLAGELLLWQRNLALKLAQTDSLTEGLAMILQSAFTASGMECGGISLKNRDTGGFDLVASVGLTKIFQEKIQYVPVGSFTWSRMMEKKSFHIRPSGDSTPAALEEGFQFISVVPILQRDEVIGFLVVASRVLNEIPEQVCIGLEFLGAELGSVIARIQTKQRLEEQITIRQQVEKDLEAERQSLEEANTALKVLLKHRDKDRKDLEEKFVENVKHLVLPHVERLRKDTFDPVQQMNISSIESNLNDIICPFLSNIKSFSFTPRQVEIVNLIRDGRTTKEIARILGMSKEAVDIQRFLIRKKLGLNKTKTNLRTHLLSLEQTSGLLNNP